MDVILIACCKTKVDAGVATYAGSALEATLTPQSRARLFEARGELGRLLSLPPGPDLGQPNVDDALRYMPAFERYAGIVYSEGAVRRLYPEAASHKILIISALYGLLDASEPIRLYELQMSATLPNGMRLRTWWKHNGLGTVLEECLLALRPARVHDLLSTDYHAALEPWPPPRLLRAGIEYQRYSYPGEGSGSSYSRGRDLRRLLSVGDESGTARELQPGR